MNTQDEITLWTNDEGESCVQNWTAVDLMNAFKYAEQFGDDVLYCVVMNEVERRGLKITE